MKTEFLAVYDYGTGGGWVYLLADSATQIHERHPELRVVSDRPNWLTDEEDQRLRERMTIDIDNQFLAALLQQRTQIADPQFSTIALCTAGKLAETNEAAA